MYMAFINCHMYHLRRIPNLLNPVLPFVIFSRCKVAGYMRDTYNCVVTGDGFLPICSKLRGFIYVPAFFSLFRFLLPIAVLFRCCRAWGYFWMSANCFATASYVLTMKFATRTMKLPKFGMVFYNNLLGECPPPPPPPPPSSSSMGTWTTSCTLTSFFGCTSREIGLTPFTTARGRRRRWLIACFCWVASQADLVRT